MSALSKHLAGGTATVCRVWIVRRADDVVLGFTDHDQTLVLEHLLLEHLNHYIMTIPPFLVLQHHSVIPFIK